MRPVFGDTAFFAAFLCPNDRYHARAVELAEALSVPILTTKWVLLELGNFLCGGPDRVLFAPFVTVMRQSPNFQLQSVGGDFFDEGIELYGRRLDKGWSLTDCISFVVMERIGIENALTTDHHFEQAGFNVLLR
jgi:uncharacterized protein